jgi:hypothetical protein
MKVLALVGCLIGGRLAAQTDYYNTDAGRPVRIEDATPTARFAFDFHFPTARVERLDGGVTRTRVEPAFSYGILPRTAVEVRAAFVFREPAATPRAGMSGVGVGLVSALNAETRHLPGLALAAELFAPTGSAKTGGPAYSLRSLVTRTTTLARVHANVTYGSYNVTVPAQVIDVCGGSSVLKALGCAGNGSVPPFIPDGPCTVSPQDRSGVTAGLCSGPTGVASVATEAAKATTNTTRRGAHWLVGLGADRALPLASILFMADVFGERYVDLFDRWDWTAELGARHQLTPSWTINSSVGRRFSGLTRAWIITAGLTRSAPLALPGLGVGR